MHTYYEEKKEVALKGNNSLFIQNKKSGCLKGQ
jgi:hypothetical protein